MKYEEVLESATEYFEGDDLAASAWVPKYAHQEEGIYHEATPDAMHIRMANEFSKVERSYEADNTLEGLSDYGKSREPLSFHRILGYYRDFRYIVPQGSVMSLLGTDRLGSLSNCIVLPEMYDSYGGINYTDGAMQALMKRRCGIGVDISNLRPKDSEVNNAASSSTGAVSFMERFSNTTREVAQNGRRGALMLTIDVAHPDVEDFVKIKQDLKRVTGANISVKLSDEFMEAVKNDTDYVHRWPIDAPICKAAVVKTVRAKDLWNTIVKCAHKTAEPGLIFWDRQHYYSTSSLYPNWKNVSTNPCSEIAMNGSDSCRLIALNMYSFVNDPYTDKAAFDFERWYEICYEAQRLSDDLVDLELQAVEAILKKINSDPEPGHIKQIEKRTWKELYKTGKEGRRTGTGYTGHADTLAALGFKYDSKQSLEVTEEIMKVKCKAEFDSSIDMAIQRGSFTDFDPEVEKKSEFVQMLQKELPDVYERMLKYGRRNISISTVAPTGTVSLLTQTSSGIEPVFKLSYTRRKKVDNDSTEFDFQDDLGDKWVEFNVLHKGLKRWMDARGIENVELVDGTITDKKCPYYQSTADEIDWIARVKLQAIVQKYTTHSISSTINLPSDIAVGKVGEIYMESWERGLKGITVYRDGSRSGVLVSNEADSNDTDFKDNHAPKRPKKLPANVYSFQNHGEKWVGLIGLLDGRPYELFTGRADALGLIGNVEHGEIIKRKSGTYDFIYVDGHNKEHVVEGLGSCFNPEFYNYGKMISGVLRHGMPVPFVVDLVGDIKLDQEALNTWKAGVSRILKKFIKDGTKATDAKCDNCGDPEGYVYQEGCVTCKSCGSSKCG